MSVLPIYAAVDDCPHTPSNDPSWQESALFVWHDRTAGIGGFWRLGHEPVSMTAHSCFGMFTSDGVRFRTNITGAALAQEDRGEIHMGLGAELRMELDGPPRIRAAFEACEAQLRFEDFHPRYEYGKLTKGPPMPGATHHFEVAGAITGEVRLGERMFQVNALGYRDRSWGPRNWNGLRSTRWWPSVYGPDLSVHILHVLPESGHLLKLGYVLRNGVAHAVIDSDVVVQLESDALSPRRGEATLHLETGECLHVSCEPSDGIALHVRGYTAVESIGTARLGDRLGMSNLEVCSNATGGSRPPVLGLTCNVDQGLSRRS